MRDGKPPAPLRSVRDWPETLRVNSVSLQRSNLISGTDTLWAISSFGSVKLTEYWDKRRLKQTGPDAESTLQCKDVAPKGMPGAPWKVAAPS